MRLESKLIFPKDRLLKQYELWARNYENDRYLAHLDTDELFQRTADLMTNAVFLDEQNRVATNAPTDQSTMMWWRNFADATTELYLRSIPEFHWHRHVMNKAQHFVNPHWKGSNRAALLTAKYKDKVVQPFLVKYGEYRFLKQMLDSGELLVRAASYYWNHATPAICDMEGQIVLQPPPNRLRVHTLGGDGKPLHEMKPIGNRIKFIAQSDHHMYCLSRELSPRLFGDFRSDSCLILKDPKSFNIRFIKALDETLRHQASIEGCNVTYIDPVLTSINDNVCTPFAKHFRYSYQKEYRIVIQSQKATTKLSDLKVKMGPLADIAELLTIDQIEISQAADRSSSLPIDMKSLLRMRARFEVATKSGPTIAR
jgi:hypothetical protein